MNSDYKLILVATIFVLFIFLITFGQDECREYYNDGKGVAKQMYERFTGVPVAVESESASYQPLDDLIAGAGGVEMEAAFPVIPEQDDPIFAERRVEEEQFLSQKRAEVNEIRLLPESLDASLNQLADRNFLISGLQVGVDSRGSSLKNANLQIRSEPAIEKEPVCIWNQSTYQADLTRKKIDM